MTKASDAFSLLACALIVSAVVALLGFPTWKTVATVSARVNQLSTVLTGEGR